MFSAPLAGRLADARHAFRLELSVFAVMAAIALLLYLPAHAFWPLVLVSLFQAAMLAPLVPLSDALTLATAQPGGDPARGAFEYGWVRGAGSAAFICGLLLAGQLTGHLGLASIMWSSACLLFAMALAAAWLPENKPGRTEKVSAPPRHVWLALLRQQSFVRLIIVAALVLGSHAMHDAFAMISWQDAGIPSSVTSVLWSESVAAEVVVFLWIGPFMLRRVKPTTALMISALCGIVRWCVLAQTAAISVLALAEPLHGFTFALLHLACMRIIAQTVPSSLAGTAQALYGVMGIGGTTALLTIAAGWLYARFGAHGFFAMAGLCIAALPAILTLRRALPPASH